MGVYRKEVKLKEVVRLRGLYNLLIKRGVGFQGMINCGEMMRKYMEELIGDKGYFSKVCLYKLILGLSLCLD